MNKITTSELIGRLKDGEIAWTQYGDFKRYVRRNGDGIFYCNAKGKYIYDGIHLMPLSFRGHAVIAKWTVFPNCVCFEEAVAAVRNGYILKLHHEFGYVEIEEDSDLEDIAIEYGGGLKFRDLLNGKYVIEGKKS